MHTLLFKQLIYLSFYTGALNPPERIINELYFSWVNRFVNKYGTENGTIIVTEYNKKMKRIFYELIQVEDSLVVYDSIYDYKYKNYNITKCKKSDNVIEVRSEGKMGSSYLKVVYHNVNRIELYACNAFLKDTTSYSVLYSFDRNRLIKIENHFNSDMVYVSDSLIYKGNNLIKIMSRLSNNDKWSYTREFRYNNNGNCDSIIVKSPDSSSYIVYSYNSQGKIIEEKRMYQSQIFINHYYYGNNYLSKVRIDQYNEKVNYLDSTVNMYNENGSLQSVFVFDKKGKANFKRYFQYEK